MKPNEKFRIVEESRFLENGEMSQISGGSCSDGTSIVISCGPTDPHYYTCFPSSTYSSCAMEKHICTNNFWMDCVSNLIACGGGNEYVTPAYPPPIEL